MSVPTISVIIPTYNCAHWVGDAISSALRQALPPSQVIIVDDGSRDDTESAVAPFVSDVVQYVRQENAGVSAARNNAFARATGDFVAFLDADDVWHPTKLERQCRIMLRRPELAMLGTATFPWPGDVPTLDGNADEQVQDILWEKLVVRNPFTTSSILARRAAISPDGSPPFDRRLQGPEDYDLWLRIIRAGVGGVLSAPLTGYRASPGGLGNQVRTMQAGMRRILEKLDRSGAWADNGGGRLRRKSYAYFHYSCAVMNSMARNHGRVLFETARSLALFPSQFGADEVRTSWARPKLMAMSALRLLRIK
jgi:glycosyltransferase involved in cell wall biosynthesis